MKSFTFQPATTTLVVFGTLLASLSQSVYGNEITNPNILDLLKKRSPLNRPYIKSSDGKRLPRRPPKFKCRMWQNCILFEEKGLVDHQWDCSIEGDDGDFRIVGVNGEKMNDWLEANGVVSGKSVLVLSEAKIVEDRIFVDTEQVVRIEDYDDGKSAERRLAYPSSGILNTLVVKVNTKDSSPPTAKQLSENIFQDPYCLKSQYGNCSYGKLDVQEYIPGTIADVMTLPNAPGVVEIDVPVNAKGSSYFVVQYFANQELKKLFGTSPGKIFDAVMFCFPTGVQGGNWLAYAYIGRWDSYYNDKWCLKLSSQMHEVGHNLGLQHAGEYTGSESDQEYGDQTDMMGYSYFEDDTPKMCFNPAKSWQLGWYSDKQLEINAGLDLSLETKSFVLNGFVDYGDNTSDRYIVLKIGSFYVGYNRAKSFNLDVREAPNKVTIVEKEGSPESPTKSRLAAKLSVSESFIIDLGYVGVEVTYESNSNAVDFDGVDAVVDIRLTGEPVVCQGEFDAEIEVQLKTDQFPEETSWGIADSAGEYIYYNSNGTYVDQLTIYTETVTGLCRGLEYFFVIEDSFGDGLCCQRGGSGGYLGKFQGSEIFSGGQFLLQEAKPFTLPLDDSPPGCEDDSEFVLNGKDCNFLAGLPEDKIVIGCEFQDNEGTKVYEYCKATCDGVGVTEACNSLSV